MRLISHKRVTLTHHTAASPQRLGGQMRAMENVRHASESQNMIAVTPDLDSAAYGPVTAV